MLEIKKVKPLFTSLIVTAEVYTEADFEGALISKNLNSLKEYQRVVAVGPLVRDIKEGDMVVINPSAYAVKKHLPGSLKDGVIEDNPVVTYNFKQVEIEGVKHLLLQDRDIEYVVEDYKEVKESVKISTPQQSPLVQPSSGLILP